MVGLSELFLFCVSIMVRCLEDNCIRVLVG